MAIMSYAESPVQHVSLGLSSWKAVNLKGDDLINRCLYMNQNEGGRSVVPSCTAPLLINSTLSSN